MIDPKPVPNPIGYIEHGSDWMRTPIVMMILVVGLFPPYLMLAAQMNAMKAENEELRRELDWWECTDRNPQKPGEPTLIQE